MTASTELGRVSGVWLMAFDVPHHIAQGWRIVDDPGGDDSGPRGFVLMHPPISLEACMLMPDGLPEVRGA